MTEDTSKLTANVWRPASVEDQPTITLNRWSVVELADGTRHFIGWCGEGRVSSSIMGYDKETKTGITRSGRKYVLTGGSGKNMDAEYVWHYWKEINKVMEYKYVTAEYE